MFVSSPHTSLGQPEVSIVVVSHNTREITLECLGSIISETPDPTFEVLFIDDDSKDGSREDAVVGFEARLVRSSSGSLRVDARLKLGDPHQGPGACLQKGRGLRPRFTDYGSESPVPNSCRCRLPAGPDIDWSLLGPIGPISPGSD